MAQAAMALDSCDLFVTVGTSSVVYPAAGFAAQVLQDAQQIPERVGVGVAPCTAGFGFGSQQSKPDIWVQARSVCIIADGSGLMQELAFKVLAAWLAVCMCLDVNRH